MYRKQTHSRQDLMRTICRGAGRHRRITQREAITSLRSEGARVVLPKVVKVGARKRGPCQKLQP